LPPCAPRGGDGADWWGYGGRGRWVSRVFEFRDAAALKDKIPKPSTLNPKP